MSSQKHIQDELEILQKVTRPKAKVVPLFARTWMRVASAAVVTGALFFGGYQLLGHKQEDPAIAVQQPVTDSSQNQLVAHNAKPFEKAIKQASTKELEDFIDAVQVNPGKAAKTATKDQDKTEVENLLKDVSVSEMESFLSALPTADDDLFVTD
ncbi:MAG: hypothetical protein EON98_02470 [Chitinophagaceae bacterium]|nr:MAG: hypothetical protein EON98_02470 [Chitinophagaceae bacterium]